MADPYYPNDQEYAPQNHGGEILDAHVSNFRGGSAFRPSDTQGEDELGPERLFAILEEAVPRPDEALVSTKV